ncbi:carboxypeptidase regulatory-like domain-containing protein [Aeoliella sp. SH292]|uniref:carboxypeptidase regulatory-like domain-containing protein n=1 Tax=Aeoliella sp. SH292 TaxID=3454464 RepID=UPI003F955655
MTHKSLIRTLTLVLTVMFFAIPAHALIFGGEGSGSVERPDWPAGAAAVFNVPQRIAYWEGPPLGGGQFHAECRGNTDELNELLVLFGRIEAANKRIVVEEGPGQSFWLNRNNEADKRKKAEMDWCFAVWSQSGWDQLKNMPADLNPTSPEDREKGPPCELTIYVGGNVDWEQLKLPEGITLIDHRLAAHGFTRADGYVVRGTLFDDATKRPLAGVVYLEKIETPEQGGYEYTRGPEVKVTGDGLWTFKNIEPAWYRIIATREGYVPRVVGYAKPDGRPRFSTIDGRLAKGGSISGSVTDSDGNGLEGARVQLYDVAPPAGTRYDTPSEYRATTDADGKFELVAPIGSARVGLSKEGWCHPGLGPEISVPATDLQLSMQRAATLTVIVLFESAEVPEQYMIELTPEGGNVVGSWGGSATLDDKNQVVLRNAPPGRYTLVGHPNPSSDAERTPPMEIELTGGDDIVKTITVTN